MLFLETKWSALMSYGVTADLLQEVLPMDSLYSRLDRTGMASSYAAVALARAAFAALAFTRLAANFALAAGDSFRLGAAFFVLAARAFGLLRNAVQRFRCAAAIRFRAAAPNGFRLRNKAGM
jgi:hypothetical protein